MAPLLLVLLILLSLLELQILWRVGGVLGVLPTLGLLLVSALAGSALIRRQGMRLVGHLRNRILSGQQPGDGLLRAGVTMTAGGLLILPGFLSDVAGLLLLLPPVRNKLARYVGRKFLRHTQIYPLPGVSGAVFTACDSDQTAALPDGEGGLKEAQARVVEDENEQKHL